MYIFWYEVPCWVSSFWVAVILVVADQTRSYSPYSQIFQNEAANVNESVDIIAAYAIVPMLWSNRCNLTLWRKHLRFAGHVVWADGISLDRLYGIFHVEYRDTESITNKKEPTITCPMRHLQGLSHSFNMVNSWIRRRLVSVVRSKIFLVSMFCITNIILLNLCLYLQKIIKFRYIS